MLKTVILSIICIYCRQIVATENNVCKTYWDYISIKDNQNCWYDPNVNSSTEEIAGRYGYTAEPHFLQTKDGYMIKLYRISKKSNHSNEQPPILMQYGIGGAPQFWMFRGEDALAFQLGNLGHDVWLSNFRGTFPEAKNERKLKNEATYWDFSFEELGMYDLPAVIDYIAKTIDHKQKLIYIGHSMGTTSSYVYAIERKEHAEKNLLGIISLAPVMFMTGFELPFKIIASFTNIIYKVLLWLRIYAYGQQEWLRKVVFSFCSRFPFIVVCDLLNGRRLGSNLNEDRYDLLPGFFSYFPTATSFKEIAHYGQIINSNRFQKFDYGELKNIEVYKATVPPQYNISRISIPIHLFVGTNDNLATLKDNNFLYSQLKKIGVKTSKHIYQDYAHNDFFMAKHYDSLCQDLKKVINILKRE